jgi:hypothetical protein
LDRANAARIFFLLSRDPDKEIRLILKQTLDTYEEELLAGMAGDAQVEPPVLHFFAAACQGKTRVLEEVALNARASAETVAFMAQRADADLLELISINEERLIANPRLVDVMLANPSIMPRVRLRLREIQVRHFGMQTEDAALSHLQKQAEEQEKKEVEAALAAPPPPDAQEVLNQVQEAKAQLIKAGAAAEGEEEEEEALNLYMRIKNMNTGQKIRASMQEGREARLLLVRDTNKAVQRAVIGCPKITIPEVEIIAQMRNVAIETLEQIAHTKAFRKSMGVIQALVKNPRTPQHVAIEMLPQMTAKDLDLIQRDRGVPEAVRKQARFVHMRKMNPKGDK